MVSAYPVLQKVDELTTKRIHEIATFLSTTKVASVKAEINSSDQVARKSMAIVYHRSPDGELEYMMLLPRSSRDRAKDNQPPSFQLASGGKNAWNNNEMFEIMRTDEIQADQLEHPHMCALREGMEELGLRLDNIASIKDMKTMQYISETSGKPMPIDVLAIEVKDKQAFDEPCKKHGKTEAVGWVKSEKIKEEKPVLNCLIDLVQVERTIRPDHQKIVLDFEAKLLRSEEYFQTPSNGTGHGTHSGRFNT